MQQVTYVSSGQIEVRDVPSARLQDSADALIEPLVVATCDLDTAMVRGKSPFPGPFPLGHEGVGRVTDIGDQVDHFTPGELVSIPFQISCGACERCRLGHTAHCTGHGEAGPQFFGIGPTGVTWGGFLSDSVRVPFADQMLVGVPEGVHPEAIASLSDNISDGYRAVAPALEASPRATVLVVGGEDRSASTPRASPWRSARSGSTTSMSRLTDWRSPNVSALSRFRWMNSYLSDSGLIR